MKWMEILMEIDNIWYRVGENEKDLTGSKLVRP